MRSVQILIGAVRLADTGSRGLATRELVESSWRTLPSSELNLETLIDRGIIDFDRLGHNHGLMVILMCFDSLLRPLQSGILIRHVSARFVMKT
jgi:hypothetical protein